MRMIGYAYEADTHCITCAQQRFNAWPSVSTERLDCNGILLSQADSVGNPVTPILDIDEGAEDQQCGTCHAKLIDQ